jgi:hypothetical protein
LQIEYSAYSILDPFGRVFFMDGNVYRGLTEEGFERYNEMYQCGMISELITKKLIPDTRIANFELPEYKCVLIHEKISPATFCYEWPFDMLKSAGLCILEINKLANTYNYETIDAHPYNILFKGCHPYFIDLGSLARIKNKKEWKGKEEFFGYYLYPLKVWSEVSYSFARKMLADDINCVSYNEFEALTQGSSIFSKSKILKRTRNLFRRAKNKLNGELLGQIEICKNRLLLIKKKTIATQWENYHDAYLNNGNIVASERFEFIVNKINEFNITTVTELAGNQGFLSYLLLEKTTVSHISCTDYDENAVNKMYNLFKTTKHAEKLSPVLLDFIKPVELINGGKISSRLKSQAVLALAITHHLLLTNKYGVEIILDRIAAFFFRICIY